MKVLVLLLLVFSLLLQPTFVSAGNTIEVPIRNALVGQGVQFSLGRIVSASINVLIVLGTIVLLLYFTMGAYKWMMAGGDKAQVEEARNHFTNGLIGMAILASVIALYTLVDQFFGVGLTNTDPGPSSFVCSTGNCDCTTTQCECGGSMCNGICVSSGGACLTP